MRLSAAFALMLPLAAQASHWDVRATLSAGSESLDVQACSRDALERVRFRAADGAAAHRHLAERSSGATLAPDGDHLVAMGWQAGECLHTRIDLGAAARGERNRFGHRKGDYVVLSPERWLWRPMRVDADSEIRFELPRGWSASVPWQPVAGKPATHRLGPTDADWPALTAFGRFDEHALALPGGVLRVAIMPPWGKRELARVEPVGRALVAAFGRLPRADAQVLIVPMPGNREAAPWGQVTRGGGSAVHLFVGAEAAPGALIGDWTATHEFSHLLHPYFGPRGRWLGEGLASYYQNVLRARVGALTAAEAWEKLEAGFERGRRETRSAGLTLDEASRGMGASRAFMRVYWSGAAFWLESDRALRAAGSSLDEALLEFAACCHDDPPAQSPAEFVAALERVAPRGGFVGRYRRYAALRGFPQIAPGRDPAIMQAR